jgi:hypothetical protein
MSIILGVDTEDITEPHIKRLFVSGLSLTGTRLSSGVIKCSSDLDVVIRDWPDEIQCAGNTYTLEQIHKFDNGLEQADYC